MIDCLVLQALCAGCHTDCCCWGSVCGCDCVDSRSRTLSVASGASAYSTVARNKAQRTEDLVRVMSFGDHVVAGASEAPADGIDTAEFVKNTIRLLCLGLTFRLEPRHGYALVPVYLCACVPVPVCLCVCA